MDIRETLLMLGVLAATFGAPSPASAVEEPAFRLVERKGAFELRDYDAYVVAETVVSGARGAAANEGFRRLANYIFGGNTPRREIAMTAPVTQTRARPVAGQSIPMTAPVTQAGQAGRWTVGFVMPAGSRLSAMPAPNDARVVLREEPRRRMAVVRFSGLATQGALDRRTAELGREVRARGLACGPTSFAFYDPPWTLPFLRRNEVMCEVAAAAP